MLCARSFRTGARSWRFSTAMDRHGWSARCDGCATGAWRREVPSLRRWNACRGWCTWWACPHCSASPRRRRSWPRYSRGRARSIAPTRRPSGDCGSGAGRPECGSSRLRGWTSPPRSPSPQSRRGGRGVRLPPYLVCGTPDTGEPPGRFGQHLLRFTKREPHEPPAQLRAAEKTRARHRRYTDLLREPEGKRVVGELRNGRVVRQYVVGALGRRATETGVDQRPAQQIPPGPVLVNQPLVIVVPQRLEPDGDRFLERRRRSHRQKVVHLADRVGRVARGHDRADTPAGDAEG